MQLINRDKKIIWHPFTQEKTAPPVIAIKKACGSYLYDENDNAYLDLISSWWVNLHGHAHPDIAQAIYDQAKCLEHVMFAGFTHEPAVTLCEQLQKLLPNELCRFFFSDNGSTAVETALKMAYQFWWNQGVTHKTLFLSFEGGYHGDTFGAMSVGKSEFHDPFSKLFFSVLTTPFPDTWENDENIEEKENAALTALTNHLENHGNQIAAIILEPLVQGASGMRMCRPDFVNKVIKLVHQLGILVIFDEVMTGFGRTGRYFALEHTHVTPDFLCLSKGLTGGFLPLALTVTNEKIFTAFLGEHFTQAFAHGHSYTANPLGCAAAISSLKLLLAQNTSAIHHAHKKGLDNLKKNCKNSHRFRLLGTIAAFDVVGQYPFNLTQTLREKFIKNGLLIRPLGNTVYLLPPYSTTPEELEEAYEKIKLVLNDLAS